MLVVAVDDGDDVLVRAVGRVRRVGDDDCVSVVGTGVALLSISIFRETLLSLLGEYVAVAAEGIR